MRSAITRIPHVNRFRCRYSRTFPPDLLSDYLPSNLLIVVTVLHAKSVIYRFLGSLESTEAEARFCLK